MSAYSRADAHADRELDEARDDDGFLYLGRAYCVECHRDREVVEYDDQAVTYEGLREVVYEVKELACGHKRARELSDTRAGF